MKKLIFLMISSLCFAEFNGEVVDNRSNTQYKQDGEIFGDDTTDGSKVWQSTGGPICSMQADCTSNFMQKMQEITENANTELTELNNQWEQTNQALDRVLNITKELPIAQNKALALEEAKLMKLKETQFNLQKALKLDPPKFEILQEKKGLSDDFLAN